jgi:PleD family two-component response regulator
MVLLRNVTDYKLCDRKFAQLQTGMKKLGEQLGYSVSFSAGVAVTGNEKVSFETLFEMADDALYEAKTFGKNCHIIHKIRSGKQQDKPVILIADNGEMNRYRLHEIFGKEYELVEAVKRSEALDLLCQHKDRVKVILLDLHLPDLDGLEVLRFINARASYHKIPVIAITNDDNSEEEARRIGVSDMIRKPYELGTVKLRIEDVLQ